MKIFYSDIFDLALPAGHRFPGQKYGMLRRALVDQDIVSASILYQAEQATTEDILLAHTSDYVEAIVGGSIGASAMRRIGFPWSPQIPLRAKATIGGAISAAQTALETGISGQLAGGTHHAHADFGSGYCVFNDFAVVARKLMQDARVSRVAIVDLDVHQGDGNAAILGYDKGVYILSLHGQKNFPFRKFKSTVDIALPDGTCDKDYLNTLELALADVWTFAPQIILYQAGVDPLKEDRLGRLDLSFQGLMDRDRMVFDGARARNIPVCVAIGGGYANPIDLSVLAYVNTWRVAREVYGW